MTYPILITNLQKMSQGSGFQMNVPEYIFVKYCEILENIYDHDFCTYCEILWNT